MFCLCKQLERDGVKVEVIQICLLNQTFTCSLSQLALKLSHLLPHLAGRSQGREPCAFPSTATSWPWTICVLSFRSQTLQPSFSAALFIVRVHGGTGWQDKVVGSFSSAALQAFNLSFFFFFNFLFCILIIRLIPCYLAFLAYVFLKIM